MSADKKNRWRIIISGKMPAAENMALDKTILTGVAQGISPNTIRLYDWDCPTVSFGFHQDIKGHMDLNKIFDNNFAFVRRPTGGRAVLHYDEVTYAVIAKNRGQFSGSILDVYKEIAYPLLYSLRDVGIDAKIADSLTNSSASNKWQDPCFSSSSKYEINFKGKKIIGSAQVRKNGAFLQHGSILLNHNQEKMADLLPIKNNEKRVVIKKYLEKKTVFINQLLDKQIRFEEFTEILKDNFIKNFEIDNIISDSLSDKELNIYQKSLHEIENEINYFTKNL